MDVLEVAKSEIEIGRLQCRLPAKMKHDIKIVAAGREERLKGACLYLCELAFANPEGPRKEYDGERTEKCIIAVDREFLTKARPYRERHAFEKKTEFFFDALSRGIQVHMDMNPK